MTRQEAAEWAGIGHFILVAVVAVGGAASAILGWSAWKMLRPLDFWLLGAAVALAITGAIVAISALRAKQEAERQAAGQRQQAEQAATEERRRATQAQIERERILSDPERHLVMDLARVAFMVRTGQTGDLRFTFKFNGRDYPDTLTFHGFAITSLSFGSRNLPRQNAADTAPDRLGAVGEIPVDVTLGPTQVAEIFNALPPEYPAEPRNLVTAHQFQVVGAFKFRDSDGRDRTVNVDRTVQDATLQVFPQAYAALSAARSASAGATVG